MKTQPHEPPFCEKESSVVAAVLAGAIPDDLVAHIGGCAVCSEVVLVSELLANEISAVPKEFHIPDAGVVWRRAQRLSREQAIARATRPIRIVRICGGIAAVLALPWAGFTFLNSPSWLPDFAHYSWTVDHSLSAAATGAGLFGIVGSVILVSLSSWYVLRQE